MDLTLFIILTIIAFMLYYLTSAIQSLIREMKEVKTKCITGNRGENVERFNVVTPDPAQVMKDKAIDALSKLKNILL
jgi:hypothetical protein